MVKLGNVAGLLMCSLASSVSAQIQFTTASVTVTSTDTQPITTSTTTQFTGFPATGTTTITVSGTSVTVVGGVTSTIVQNTFLGPTTTTSTSTESILETVVVTVTSAAPSPNPSVIPVPTCGFASNCAVGKTICVSNIALCDQGGCEPGFYVDGEDEDSPGVCRSCAQFDLPGDSGTTCFECDSEMCIDCGDGFSTDPETGMCFSCSEFGLHCSSCTGSQCIECETGSFLDLRGLCKECSPTPACQQNSTLCTDGSFSSCLQGECDPGFFNSILLPNSTCLACRPATGCRAGFERCLGDGNSSVCVTDQCLPYWYNLLNFTNPAPPAIDSGSDLAANSTCSPLIVTFETDLGESFLLDVQAQIDWLDSLAQVLVPDPDAGVRTQFQYRIFYRRIYPNEYRNNLIDIGLELPTSDIQAVQTLFLQNDVALRRVGITCLVIGGTYLAVDDLDDERPYGAYQRPLCLDCVEIPNCAVRVSCEGNNQVSQCAACEVGYYQIPGKYRVSDQCVPCPEAFKCNEGFSRCPQFESELLEESRCVDGECRDSYSGEPSPNTTLLSQFYVNTSPIQEVTVTCEPCPTSYGCKNRESSRCTLTNTPVLGQEFKPTFTGTCLSGACEKPFYNYVGDCLSNNAGTTGRSCYPEDTSACFLASLSVQIPYDWGNVTAEVIQEFDDLFALTFGLQTGNLDRYPFSTYVLGIRQNKTSGNILVDMFVPATSVNTILQRAVAEPADEDLALTGAQIISTYSDCVTAGYDTVPHPIQLNCVKIDNCLSGNTTCDWGPYAARCTECQQGYFNNASIGYYPDQCVACPTARNCTDAATDGSTNTVCTCPSDSQCLSGQCEYGYWNNPPLPLLDCGFNDSYSCWPETTLRKASRGHLAVSQPVLSNVALSFLDPASSDLYSAELYGLRRTDPFHTCPEYGVNEPASKRDRMSGYNVGYWNFNATGQFWADYNNRAIFELQKDDKWTKTCGPRPEPKNSSYCRRWTECEDGEYESVRPTAINDRRCETCTECDYSLQYRAQNCTQFLDTICINCIQACDCPVGTWLSCPCTGAAQGVCSDCTIFDTNCATPYCVNGAETECLFCNDDYYLNQTQNLCVACSVSACGTQEYLQECTDYEDSACLDCPRPEHCANTSTWECTGPRDTYCEVGGCVDGYSNNDEERTCVVDGTAYNELFYFKGVQLVDDPDAKATKDTDDGLFDDNNNEPDVYVDVDGQKIKIKRREADQSLETKGKGQRETDEQSDKQTAKKTVKED
ncbi:hypothetical protein SARC_01386 [Sphaeroforma arctica JP610]|uniref:TNFR-Cys domain-containing protein n=1 Tax=Sphaeroforma arctica JP610 TaxID=667725 RepID=A0A0L0GBT8_9EUKA|nr:hypothetical protein SARC_01386 [Sphaeroforma arctica JP610]KNC86477.1 hypothetical protein SARC_01386 [Sphaeroforma arctica JP610]|eukprot:XP_014160379.1 hypothetical protein SARC_01386 [Sphaeroforma arctica JP610]